MKQVLLIAVCAAALCAVSSDAHAQNGIGYGYGFGYYPQYGRDYIPYYALHPPVYYSYPVPRPYGYSPFAYPPGVMTPEVEAVPAAITPKVIENPYVKTRQVPRKPELDATTKIEPLRIINPFVSDVRLATQSRD